ncbi:helix-turn-helix domain-containing protein [Moritella viscosa]|uniref:Transcriptional regulator, MerR family n=1 Tax=Moritella viscosa TaxID=80854 RepID=A0ABY1HHL8_9GAMM|nr:helix-turn-helix domain-containing protein [Moritella viscosa]CED60115.1 transcriptional regulator, MerR family [Moritella viscosa]SGY99158.1 Transcriptional regulator, MerR family [Moritella viscosa]SGZ06235.1 Transcriptional regulator, MerR family [Moritella viscosa]SGZ06430.1 Transcriptional regulator, MerR family [Moritella viscosa]SGZ13947.1 Transcriptional regulator, MerR family [Moritella viscosa]
MDIGDVSKTSGLPASTLRFYEEKGLIRSNGRNGLRRLFDASVIEKLALISLGRSAGFSLDEIGKMFTPEGPEINRTLLSAKADELDKKIRELTEMRNGLRHAAACKVPNQLDCPKFLHLLHIAGKNRSRKSNILKEHKLNLGV